MNDHLTSATIATHWCWRTAHPPVASWSLPWYWSARLHAIILCVLLLYCVKKGTSQKQEHTYCESSRVKPRSQGDWHCMYTPPRTLRQRHNIPSKEMDESIYRENREEIVRRLITKDIPHVHLHRTEGQSCIIVCLWDPRRWNARSDCGGRYILCFLHATNLNVHRRNGFVFVL